MRKTVRAIVLNDDKFLLMYRNKFGNEYYSLVGGGIDVGETPEQSLFREIQEETSLEVANPRLVITEDAGPMYGIQYIFLCEYISGEPKLDPNSEEAQITSLGKNLFEPKWVPIADLPSINLLPVQLKDLIIEHLDSGFSEEVLTLTINE